MRLPVVAIMLVLPYGASAQQQASSIIFHFDRIVASRATEGNVAEPAPPRLGFSRRKGSMVGYIEDAGTSSQIRLRVDAAFDNTAPDRAEFFYGKCGCYRQLATLAPAAFDPDAPGPGPGVVAEVNYQQVSLDGRLAVGDRAALIVELPFRFLQPQSFDPAGPPGSFGNSSGLSDIRAGAKLALAATPTATLTFQLKGYFKTGDAGKGLGTNHNSVEPALLLSAMPNDRFRIESQVGYFHPIGGSAGVPTASDKKFSGDVFFYGIGPSFELINNKTLSLSPVLELVGWHVGGGFVTVAPAANEASGTNIINLKIGARTTFSEGQSVYVGYGRSLTDQKWYRDIFRLEYRREF